MDVIGDKKWISDIFRGYVDEMEEKGFDADAAFPFSS